MIKDYILYTGMKPVRRSNTAGQYKEFHMRNWGAWSRNIILVLLLSGCGSPATGRWVGSVTPEPGSQPAPGCHGPGRGVLTVRGQDAVFTPDDGVAVLTGTARDTTIRTTSVGVAADKQPLRLLFEGRIEGDQLTGTYAAPRCRARVMLRRE
jgi:hypothetical protein